MPLRHKAAAIVLAIAVLPSPLPGQQSLAQTTPTPAEIVRALDAVKQDPNLATDRTIRTLAWRESTTPRPRRRTPEWMAWLGGLFRWVTQSARVLMWAVVLVLIGVLAAYVVRLLRSRSAAGVVADEFVAPTHVRDLDIRPETLPDDVGAAARALWDRGEHRAALALLYRGSLSRLAHVWGVPIRDSSTEGDCLALAAGHLTATRTEYTTRLIHVWQRAVYGHVDAETVVVHRLCDGFAAALDAPAVSRREGGTA